MIIENNIPVVSIIVTTYNRNRYLEHTLRSIQNQTYTYLEILVVDDGSNAEESKLNQSICSKFLKCHYYYKPNTGQPDSRNYGIQKVKGKFIGFCDDDDVWVLDKLEKQIKVFEAHPEIFVVTGDTATITQSGERTGDIKSHAGFNHGYIFEHLLLKNRTASIIPLVRKEVFEKVGYFNPSFTIAEDWEFWRRVSYYYPFYAINEVLGYVRLHDSNMSITRVNSAIERSLLYRKLTKSLLDWGKDKFTRKDYDLVKSKEWHYYKTMLINRHPKFKDKVSFIFRLTNYQPREIINFLYLYLRFQLFNN
ncbi:glycosyltransferase family 2 protein [Geojedonia litorea]|uniref:Glycosyltransferase family 2 protein n=1 Tax=Geojedonia litorea TaxID=1268269 RepID=A0ABV9N196_9FLAO